MTDIKPRKTWAVVGPDGAKYWLGELLAVIHRDGGHYLAKHGTEKSVKAALEEINRLKVAADGTEALLRECYELIKHSYVVSPPILARIRAHLSGKERT